MNKHSVEKRFHIKPKVQGKFEWDHNRLIFVHARLKTSKTYTVTLKGGYKSRSGVVNGITHYWTFTTQPPPTLVGSSPGNGSASVSPTSEIELTFSRPMNLESLEAAVNIAPFIPFNIVPATQSASSVFLVTSVPLTPDQLYQVTIDTNAKDIFGNPLHESYIIDFKTGTGQPLYDTLTYLATSPNQRSGIVMLAEPSAPPRPLTSTQATNFFWERSGLALLLHLTNGQWGVDNIYQNSVSILPFKASWVYPMSNGYLYLNNGTLYAFANNTSTPIADNVAVTPAATNIANVAVYASASGQGQYTLWQYNFKTQSARILAVLNTPPSILAVSPDGQLVAYVMPNKSGNQQTLYTIATGPSAKPTAIASGIIKAISVSPNDSTIAVEAISGNRSNPIPTLFELQLSSGMQNLNNKTSGLPTPPYRPATNPEVSTYGHRIAFLMPDQGGLNQVFIINADGSNLHQVTHYSVYSPYEASDIQWSPPSAAT
jgi:hypothetical protein